MTHYPSWSHWPQYKDDLPQYPDWVEGCKDGRQFWATRLEASAFGIVVVPTSETAHYLQSPLGQFLVELTVIDPRDQWTGPLVRSQWVESYDEGLAVASEYRERLEAFAVVAALE